MDIKKGGPISCDKAFHFSQRNTWNALKHTDYQNITLLSKYK